MKLYEDNIEYFSETKYHQVAYHPVRFTILKAKMSVKEQERFKEYLKEKLNIEIRVVREHGISNFMSSKISNKKAIAFLFENYEDISKEFEFKEFNLDLSILNDK